MAQEFGCRRSYQGRLRPVTQGWPRRFMCAGGWRAQPFKPSDQGIQWAGNKGLGCCVLMLQRNKHLQAA